MPSWSRRRCASPASCSACLLATSSPRRPPPARDHDRGRTRLGRIGGEPAGRSPCYAARPFAASRRSGGADRGRGEPGPDELWATISPMLAAAPAAQQILLSTPAGASGEFPPRLVLRRRLGACADHRRSMSTHLSRASRRRAHSPGRCSLPPGVFRCLRVGAGQRLRRRGAGAHVWRSCRG